MDGVKSRWTRKYVTIDDLGTLSCFQSEAEMEMVGECELKRWPKDNVVASQSESKWTSFRIAMKSKKGAIHFAFESEQRRNEMMHSMQRHFRGQRAGSLSEPDFLFLTANNVLWRFSDETMTDLRAQVDLKKVALDNVVAVGQRSFIVVEGGGGEPAVFWAQNEEEKRLWIERLRERIQIMNEMVDLEPFKNMKHSKDCHDDEQCAAVQRILQSLDLFAALKSSTNPIPKEHGDGADEVFTEFMDQHYGANNVLRDYIHFLDRHFEAESMRKIAKRLRFGCDAVGRCKGTQRHFRERGNEQKEEMATNRYIDTVDGLHFLLCHLEEMGLRVPAQLLQSEMKAVDEEEDEESLVDAVIKRMAQEIAARRNLLSVDRLDGATNSKFNISTTIKKEKGSLKMQTCFGNVFDFLVIYLF